MIELVITACLATADCQDFRLPYYEQDASIIACMIGGSATIARWNAEHPAWIIRRWSCGVRGPEAADI